MVLSVFVSIVLSVLAMGISSVPCAGAGDCSLMIARRFITTGICGRGTPAGTG